MKNKFQILNAQLRADAIKEMDKDEYDRVFLPDTEIDLYWIKDGKVNNGEYFSDWELDYLTTESLCLLADSLEG